jgi:glycosyltransferase involved in cell wall biosynthesis
MSVPPTAPADGHPILSVVLPNYNHGRLIGRAIAALRRSDRQPDEIFVIDDASTDDSLRVIEELAGGWNIIRVVVNKENQGAIAALARGLQDSRGKYIYFAAADDWIEEDFFSAAIEMLERHSEAGLFCGETNLVDGSTGQMLGIRPVVRLSNRPVFLDPSEVRRLLRRSDNWILTGSAVFRRDRVLEAGGLSAELASFADGYLARSVALRHGFCFAPRTVATWCIFEHGLSRTTSSDPEQALPAMEKAVARMIADPAFPRWYPALFDRRWRFAMLRLAVLAQPVNLPVLLRLSVTSTFGRGILGVVCRLPRGPSMRLPLLAWLWLRFRPVGLIALSGTAWARYWERWRGRSDGRLSMPVKQTESGQPRNE